MKLLANSFYGYQITDWSGHTVTKFLSDGKTDGAINNKMFMRLGCTNDQLYEVDLVKSEIENKKSNIVRFFVLQYAKLRILELYYNLFVKYCDVKKFEELEMDTKSVNLALSEHDLYYCIWPARKKLWNPLRSGDCTHEFWAKSTTNFLPSCLLR